LADSKYLIITIPSSPHEHLHGLLDDKIYLQVATMGLNDDFMPTHATKFQDKNAGSVISAGEGDSARKPLSGRPLGSDFPTLVIEAGVSQTLQSLRQKARWWFNVSKGDVKVVLLVKMAQNQGSYTIHLEKWKVIQMPQPGATTRARAAAAAAAIQPQSDQTIDIIRAPGISNTDPNRFNPMSYNVTGGSLRLEFVDLFLRQPIPPETDVVLSQGDLQQYAAICWKS
jgi:hypothetical protein